MNKLLITIFLVLSTIFLLHYIIVGQAVYGDGIYYFAYPRSLVIDHDLNFSNEYSHHYDRFINNTLTPDSIDQSSVDKTATNLRKNRYPIGAPLLWLPSFILAHIVATLIHIFDNSFPNNGYSDIYQIFVGLSNILFVVIGIAFLYKALRIYFSEYITTLTVLSLLFATNLFYYSSLDVINSHPSSFLVSVLILYLLIKDYKSKKYGNYFLIGTLIGLLTLIRTQDITFLLPAIYTTILILKKRHNYKELILKAVLLIAGIFLAFLPQLLIWKIIYGTYLALPYLEGHQTFSPLQIHLAEVLFNYKTGLLIWTPVYLILLSSNLYLLWKKNYFGYISLGMFIIQMYVISIWSGWQQGEAFGIRMLISTLPFLAYGLGYFYQKIQNKSTRKVALILCICLISLNCVLISVFNIFIKGQTFNGTTTTRQQELKYFHSFLKKL